MNKRRCFLKLKTASSASGRWEEEEISLSHHGVVASQTGHEASGAPGHCGGEQGQREVVGSPGPTVLHHEAQGHGDEVGQGREHHDFPHEASGAPGHCDGEQGQQEVVGSPGPTSHEDAQDLWEEAGQGMEVQDLPHEAYGVQGRLEVEQDQGKELHGFPHAASVAPGHGEEEQAQAHREVVGSPEPKGLHHEAWDHSEQGKGQEC